MSQYKCRIDNDNSIAHEQGKVNIKFVYNIDFIENIWYSNTYY